jgi:very-short-patch-repair endonuclease
MIDRDKKSGKPKVVRKKAKKTVPLTYHKKFTDFFRLIEGNPSIPDPVEEFKFHPKRKWSIDLFWPDQKLALEIEGGTYMKSGGGHRSITGYHQDMEKYNAICVYGFSLLRFTTKQMESCEAYDVLREWFKNRVKNRVKT